ncbi:MAG: DUF3422 domain-containing protein [Proteobacteria bacterium]|nr:DUF3422 domain-containing protein [Pseudomonadota bacterium]MDA1022501.1 DUF3422 domain-containing protein [Pseudomonadota bacterium]
MTGFKEHPLRETLAREMHARPFGVVDAPAKISYLAVVNGEISDDAERQHLSNLCSVFKVPPPPGDATHFAENMGRFRLKWERHTEFATYTFICEEPFEQPFKEPVIDLIPEDWLSAIPGEVLVASHIAIEGRDMPERAVPELVGLFDNNTVMGGHAGGGRALVWTDFKIHEDRFRRILVRDIGMNHRAMARLVQRVVEIETYRSLAMLALPLARDARFRVSGFETEVSNIITSLAGIDGVDDERKLLARLSILAAEAEQTSVETSYRFSAARAYYNLVKRRLEDIREDKIVGLQSIGEFIDKRLGPAMETVENAASRQEVLSRRIARASDLLRTRVDVALEEQNRDLLRSMDRRARLQLRLQATVEGLSVVAISYYLLSLISYLAKGARGFGVVVDPFVVVTIAFPFVAFGVWAGVRRVRRSVTARKEEED